ncbi:MAG: insulinase family protein [Planctomycetes bacterium]|nr:insulinase family protein [Planctomycetota bacterium]
MVNDAQLLQGLDLPIFKDIKKAVLPNGLTCFVKEQHEVPNIGVAIGYRVGSYNEEDGIRGASHFLEHMMFKTTKKLKVGDIDKIAFEGGGMANAYTSNDVTVYYFKVNSDKLKTVLEAEAERMVNLTFIENEFRREIKVVLEEMNRMYDTPWGKLSDNIYKVMFEKSPFKYPVIGYREELEQLQIPRVFEYYQKYYNPRNAFLTVIGDVDKKETLNLINALFGQISGKDVELAGSVFEPEQGKLKTETVSINADVPRAVIAYRTDTIGSKVDVVCEVIELLLTGSRSSVLNKEFVEEKKLIRMGGISSRNSSEPYHGSALMIFFEPNTGIDPQKLSIEIIDTIETFATRVTEDGLRKAKNLAQSRFVYSNEPLTNLVLAVTHMATIGQLETYSNYLKLIEEVTLDDVKKVANEYLKSVRANVLIGIPEVKSGS